MPSTRKLFNLVNSIDTPVCEQETINFENLRESDYTHNFTLCTISMDLPFALHRFRKAHRLNQYLLSDHRTGEFGIAYGSLMHPDRLLQRTAFVLDSDNTISYVKYFEDQGIKPDYSDAFRVLRR